MKGKFIVLEGIDANGKHTQARLLKKRLEERGIDVVITEEPRYGDTIGGWIRQWLQRKVEISSPHAITLLYAADRYEHNEKIREWLDEGKWVVSARYYHSTYAFQGGFHGIDREWIDCIHRFCMKPDLAILIDITAEEAIRRKSEERYERLDVQERARREYLKLAQEGMLEIVDGMGTPGEVFGRIWKKVEVLL